MREHSSHQLISMGLIVMRAVRRVIARRFPLIAQVLYMMLRPGGALYTRLVEVMIALIDAPVAGEVSLTNQVIESSWVLVVKQDQIRFHHEVEKLGCLVGKFNEYGQASLSHATCGSINNDMLRENNIYEMKILLFLVINELD